MCLLVIDWFYLILDKTPRLPALNSTIVNGKNTQHHGAPILDHKKRK